MENIQKFQNLFVNQNTVEESQAEKLAIKILNEQYSKEISDKDDIIKKFESISDELIKMGFEHKIVLRSFLVYKYSTLEEGIEILSKNEDLWNHKFTEAYNERCYICGDQEKYHRSIKNIFITKSSLSIDDERIKLALEKHFSFNSNKGSSENLGSYKKANSYKIISDSCPICFIEITADLSFTVKCSHKFCKDCIISYIEEEIKNARVKIIKCPQNKCDEILNEELINTLINEETLEKYIKFLEREKIKTEKNIVHCPITDCEGFAIKKENNLSNENNSLIASLENDSPNKKLLDNENDVILNISADKEKIKYICNKSHPFCGKCRNIWHDDECNEDRAVKEFATTSGTILKKCGKCRVWTEKNEGCNHMTCQICKFEWCWLCENLYTPNHYELPGPCFGRMFNENPDPLLRELIERENNNEFFYNIFFIFYYSSIIISIIIRNNFDVNQPNNARPRQSRIGLFCFISLITLCMSLCSMAINGSIIAIMIKNLIKMNQVNSVISRLTCVLTNMVLFLPLYFVGMIITVIWFIFIIFYSMVKLCFS